MPGHRSCEPTLLARDEDERAIKEFTLYRNSCTPDPSCGEAQQGGPLRLPHVRHVYSSFDRADLSDALPEKPSQRSVRWRARQWSLRSVPRAPVRLGASRRTLCAPACLARSHPCPATACRLAIAGHVLLDQFLQWTGWRPTAWMARRRARQRISRSRCDPRNHARETRC